ncbi:CHRD domain-containing protein [Actinopolymorpha sp. B17G11]|uniref:CHRD domain-containing protein n=1 Tax=Actinopolymorpha sp. B17G11 TaxID=3160861 RepID=UPI0032E39313
MRAWCLRTVVFLAGMGAVLAAGAVPAQAATAAGNVDARSHGGTVLGAVLTGAAEVPGPGDDDGRGLFVGKVKGDLLCYVLVARRIEEPMAAHIHVAPEGAAGPIVVGLIAPVGGYSADCIRAVPDDQNSTATLSESELASIRSDRSGFYVNVHTASFPAGAIRGQLF